MPVPYRRTPRAAEIGLAGYIDIVLLESDRTFYGGLLIIDGKGQPQEFVHNFAASPSDAISVPSPTLGGGNALWSEEMIWRTGIPLLAHSLFDACRREPDILVCLPSLGTPEFCTTEITPSIPFAQAVPPNETMLAEWSWMNAPPSSGMRASLLAQELVRRGFIIEPFDRLREALRLVYPQAPWDTALGPNLPPMGCDLMDKDDAD